jgi:hypothetical protein
MSPSSPRPHLAVLIDAENASASHAEALMARVHELGKPTVRWAYGDWTTPQLTPWKRVLSPLGIRPQQQFHHVKGKNTTDSALIMDAMELLHGGRVQGICIVSSDSDFIGLAARIQEAGVAVYGFGVKGTVQGFVRACDEFVFLDELVAVQGA